MNAVNLYREIDALGGTGEGEWHKGYCEALTDVLAILKRRGFSELDDPIDELCAAVEAVLVDLGAPGQDGWTSGYAHTTDLDRLQQAIANATGAA